MLRVRETALLAAILITQACSWKTLDAAGPFGPPPKASDTNACDNSAADPNDRFRRAAGVPDDAIVGTVAVEACQEAVSQFPEEPRFHFQLGRAHLALHQRDESHEQFAVAAASGHAPARYYLAEEMLESYWKSGVVQDAERALEIFRETATEYPPSADRYDKWFLSTEGFENPRIVQAIYEQSFSELQDARLLVAEYLIGVQDYLGQRWNPTSNHCPAVLIRRAIDYRLDAAASGDASNFLERKLYDFGVFAVSKIGTVLDPVWAGDVERYRKYLRDLGAKDAQFLAERYGCDSMAARQFYDGVIAFAGARRPLKDYYRLVMDGSFRKLFLGEDFPLQSTVVNETRLETE